jgi:hypothetical protein
MKVAESCSGDNVKGIDLFEWSIFKPLVNNVFIIVRVNEPEKSIGVSAPTFFLPVCQ